MLNFRCTAGWPLFVVLCSALAGSGLAAEATKQAPLRWWKGNLHTHTLWSDGDDYPEMVVRWYQQHDYQFLALSDHNVLLQGASWIAVTNHPHGEVALTKYLDAFGEEWVQTSFVDDTQLVRLKTLAEFRPRFEEPGRFLLIPSEEITSRHRLLPIHINVTNPRELVRPQTGSNVSEVIQKTMDAVQAQQKRTGQPMFPHLNHPNFGWGITAEDMMAVRGEKFFEVYNGHPTVHNEGDAHHASTDRMWDILLTFRLTTLRLGPVYGLGVDDCHHYHTQYRSNSIPGRGWICVRSAALKTESLIAAMEAGDFYASSGVRLKDVQRDSTQLALEIDAEPEVSYVTKFIGTRTGFDLTSTPGPRPTNSVFAVTRRYSSDIGTVLATVPGHSPSYKFKGDEIYVRAQVISSKAKVPMITAPEMEAAWVQPVVLFPKR